MYVQEHRAIYPQKLGKLLPCTQRRQESRIVARTGREIANIANRAIYIKQQIPFLARQILWDKDLEYLSQDYSESNSLRTPFPMQELRSCDGAQPGCNSKHEPW